MDPRVTVIIPNWNGIKWLPKCLEALENQSFKSFKIVVVDNSSTDSSLSWIQTNHPSVNILPLQNNFGFAYAANRGIEAADTPYVCLLNNDTVADKNWLERLYMRIDQSTSEVAGVGSLMLSLDHKSLIDDAGNSLSWYMAASKCGHGINLIDYTVDENPFSISAGAAIYRRQTLVSFGGFDESFFAYLEDIDLGLRARMNGLTFLLEKSALVLHKSHGSQFPQKKYVKQITSNRLAIIIKNIPIQCILKNIGKLIYGQIYFFIAFGKPISSLQGYFSFVAKAGHYFRSRKKNLSRTVLSIDEINSLLLDRPPAPSLQHFFNGYLKSLKNLLHFNTSL